MKPFNGLKQAMAAPSVLALTDFSRKFLIECDVSGARVGVVLMEEGRPLAFLSQALKDKSLFLSTYEKELLALLLAIQKWRPYLLGQHHTIRTDQQSLKDLLEQQVGTPTQQKWLAKLMGYDFNVVYRSEIENR